MREDLFVASRDKAARIAGISTRQIDYWSSTGLVRPSIEDRLTPGRRIRLYDFTEMLAVMVVAKLRKDHDVPLQEVRRVVEYIRNSLSLERPLNEVTFAVHRRRLYFMTADGHWENDRVPGQSVIPEALNLRALRIEVERRSQRRPSDVGRIERRRRTMGHKPLIAGTRVPVATIQRYLAAGRSVDQITAAYPALRPEDVEAARAASAA
ncbi:MAG: DUF433 domain-containing protein [Actinomycetota bacterium]|nr:DUF433 domain-containing protein [Actinomycetota bacterium]